MGSIHIYDDFSDHKSSQYTHGRSAIGSQLSRPHSQGNERVAAWLRQVLLHAGSKPQEAFIKLLRGRKSHPDNTAAVLNQARSLIAKVFPFVGPNKLPGLERQGSLAKASACEQLFKLCLHRVLLLAIEEAAALQGLSSPQNLPEAFRDAAVAAVIGNVEVLNGLAQCCVEIVVFAHLTSPSESFPAASQHMGRQWQWIELLQGLVWVRHSRVDRQGANAGDGIVQGLPGKKEHSF